MTEDSRPIAMYALTIITLVSVGISMTVMTSDAFGSKKSAYDSGYDKGCSDASIINPSARYINQPGKGYSYHTDAFNEGYYNGFEDCSAYYYDAPPPEQAQSQSQSSNNENNNNNENSLSQSQATTIYICKENGCIAQ